MVEPSFGNVINLQPGGPGVSASANRILMECRDLAARMLREALRELLRKIGEDIQRRATVGAIDNRRALQAMAGQLAEKSQRMEAQLAAQWVSEFDTVLKGRAASAGNALQLEELQIVDYDEMDAELALKALGKRLDSQCEEALYAMGRRFASLNGQETQPESDNPAAPEVLVRALQKTFQDAGLDLPTRVELARCLDSLVVDQIAPVYHAINARLVKHNVLPTVRRNYARSSAPLPGKDKPKPAETGDMFAILQRLVSGAGESGFGGGSVGSAGAVRPAISTGQPSGPAAGAGGSGGAMPAPLVWASLEQMQHTTPAYPAEPAAATSTANVLHNFRASEVGQGLGQLDAITVDIVAMLFDMIFDDREIADPIKALVAKLQIPVLKVAMLDRSFFSSKAHPTRRLLDLISHTAMRWGREISHDDPLYQKIAAIIDEIQTRFQQDTALFATLHEDLEKFVAAREATTEGNVTRAAMLVVKRELEELAGIAADCELRAWLENPLPKVIADLLNQEWRALLIRTHQAEGPESDAWKSAVATATALIESTRPIRSGKDRQALVRELPILLRQISAGFETLSVDADRRHALLDGLLSLHAGALRGSAALEVETVVGVPTPPAEAAPSVTSLALADGELTVESLALSSPQPPETSTVNVQGLQRGDWAEFTQADGAVMRYRLSWISPKRGIFLFTNPESPNALAVSPEAMNLKLELGEARIVPTEPIFERALNRTLETLQAA